MQNIKVDHRYVRSVVLITQTKWQHIRRDMKIQSVIGWVMRTTLGPLMNAEQRKLL